MDQQLIAVKNMLGGIPEWLAEIQSSPDHQIELRDGTVAVDNSAVTDGTDRINEWGSVEIVAPYPRMEIMNGRWMYDFHMGNCISDATEYVTIELIRPTLDASILTVADLEAASAEDKRIVQIQYLEVLQVVRTIFQEFSRLSYQSGAQFAQAKVEVVAGPWFVPQAEVPLLDLDDKPLTIWWTNIVIESKSY